MYKRQTLDLVGIGTIGDIVPLVDENRTLAKYGIRAVNVSQRPGLTALIEGVSLKQGDICSENISYVIVPHLNASGRMESARTAAKLMMARDPKSIEAGVEKLVACNRRRKQLQEETFEQCRELVENQYRDDLFYVIDLPDAHEGITRCV